MVLGVKNITNHMQSSSQMINCPLFWIIMINHDADVGMACVLVFQSLNNDGTTLVHKGSKMRLRYLTLKCVPGF